MVADPTVEDTPTARLLELVALIVPVSDGAPRGTDGRIETPTGPHVILHGGTPTPTSLNLNHDHATTSHTWQLVCVSNNPHGARLIADRIARAIDGQQADGHPHDRYTVTHASPPIEDRDDPAAWRWTTTVEVQLTTGR